MLFVLNRRTKTPPNERLSPTVRLERSARRNKPDVSRNPIRQREESRMSLKHWVAILILAPLALITIFTVVEMFGRMWERGQLWATEEFRFFTLGILGWAASYGLAGLRPVRTYVFGHELSHYLMAKASGATVYDFHFSAKGGYVETDKSNTLISLAPYLMPIYSIAVLLIFGVLALFVDLGHTHYIGIAGVAIPLKWTRLMYLLLGITWAFHVTYTWITLRGTEQTDLTRNGEFFSLMLISLINAALLMSFFVVTSTNPELGLLQTTRCWWGTACWLIPGL